LERYEEAISDYDEALRIKPDFADAYVNRGYTKLALQQYTDVISDCDAALRIKPDSAHAYYNRGIAKHELGRTWEAKDDLQTALKLADKAKNHQLKTSIEQYIQELEVGKILNQ
jgi:tetratricopeptide (TPR) repeat protein